MTGLLTSFRAQNDDSGTCIGKADVPPLTFVAVITDVTPDDPLAVELEAVAALVALPDAAALPLDVAPVAAPLPVAVAPAVVLPVDPPLVDVPATLM